MIVSALVVTCPRSMQHLVDELRVDARLFLGEPEMGFLPVVVTSDSLSSSRKIYEELRTRPGVDDVQLVSWADEDAILDAVGTPSAEKEQQ